MRQAEILARKLKAVQMRLECLAGEAREFRVRDEADRPLSESAAHLRLAHAAARMGAWEWDPGTGKIWWSPELEAIHGLPPGGFGGTSEALLELVHPSDRERVRQTVSRAVIEETDYDVEFRFVCPDGSVRWRTGIGRAVRDDSGRTVRMIGVGQDITRHKHLERQLSQAQKMEVIGRLAGGIAHDFNNILLVIKGCSECLLESLANTPEVGDVEEIAKAADRAVGLTRQLLAFSRRQVVQPTLLDLNEVIEDADKLLQRLIGENVVLVTALAPELWLTMADRSQVEQLIVNLAANARDAMGGDSRLRRRTCSWTARRLAPCLASRPARTSP